MWGLVMVKVKMNDEAFGIEVNHVLWINTSS